MTILNIGIGYDLCELDCQKKKKKKIYRYFKMSFSCFGSFRVWGVTQDVEVEEHSLKRESTLVNSRMETRSMSRSSSLLTLPEVHHPISWNDEVSTSKKPSSRVVKNHLESNIIGSLDEGLHLRKGSTLIANHVTYHCYLAQFEPKRVEEALQDEN